jgi:hypothetical protein
MITHFLAMYLAENVSFFRWMGDFDPDSRSEVFKRLQAQQAVEPIPLRQRALRYS